MPAANPTLAPHAQDELKALGSQMRARRKALRVSATAAAEAAGISRVTLYRLEKGEPSVTIGAWANALAVLGMQWTLHSPGDAPQAPSPLPLKDWLPLRIWLADYPQLKALAWQVHGTDVLTPAEALDIYERNARHLDEQAMPTHEQALLAALREAFGRTTHHV